MPWQRRWGGGRHRAPHPGAGRSWALLVVGWWGLDLPAPRGVAFTLRRALLRLPSPPPTKGWKSFQRPEWQSIHHSEWVSYKCKNNGLVMVRLLPVFKMRHTPGCMPVIKKQTNFSQSSLRKTTHFPSSPWQTKLISLLETQGLPALILCSAQPCAKTASWCSKGDHAKSWRCQLPRLGSMVMPR